MDIVYLDLSVLTYNVLKRRGINTTEELCSMSEDDVMKIRNLGRKSLEELLRQMKTFDLHFKS